jgi:hypothetical protein
LLANPGNAGQEDVSGLTTALDEMRADGYVEEVTNNYL